MWELVQIDVGRSLPNINFENGKSSLLRFPNMSDPAICFGLIQVLLNLSYIMPYWHPAVPALRNFLNISWLVIPVNTVNCLGLFTSDY